MLELESLVGELALPDRGRFEDQGNGALTGDNLSQDTGTGYVNWPPENQSVRVRGKILENDHHGTGLCLVQQHPVIQVERLLSPMASASPALTWCSPTSHCLSRTSSIDYRSL